MCLCHLLTVVIIVAWSGSPAAAASVIDGVDKGTLGAQVIVLEICPVKPPGSPFPGRRQKPRSGSPGARCSQLSAG
jgi:hypothetical protein